VLLASLPWPYSTTEASESVVGVALATLTGAPACISHCVQRYAGEHRVIGRGLLGIAPGVMLAGYGAIALPLAAGMGVLQTYARWVTTSIHRPAPLYRARLPRALDPTTGLHCVPALPSLALALLSQQPSKAALDPREAVVLAVLLAPATAEASGSSVHGTSFLLCVLSNLRLCVLLASTSAPLSLDALESGVGVELRSAQISVELHDVVCATRSEACVRVIAWGARQENDDAFAPAGGLVDDGDRRDAPAADGGTASSMLATARALWTEHGLPRLSDAHAHLQAGASAWGWTVAPVPIPLRCLALECADNAQAAVLHGALQGHLEMAQQLRSFAAR